MTASKKRECTEMKTPRTLDLILYLSQGVWQGDFLQMGNVHLNKTFNETDKGEHERF